MEATLTIPQLFVTSFLVAFSGALMPGPMLAVTVSEAPRRGAVTGPLVVAGHALAELLLVAGIVAGLAEFLKRDDVTGVVGLVGGVVLLVMGTQMVAGASKQRLSAEPGEKGGLHPFWGGLVSSVSNPYWTIWWATIGLGYLVLGLEHGAAGLVAFFSGHILADLVWFSLVGAALAKGERLMSELTFQRMIAGCGVFLALFGLWFGYGGAGKLLG